jgi:hypothetical protein
MFFRSKQSEVPNQFGFVHYFDKVEVRTIYCKSAACFQSLKARIWHLIVVFENGTRASGLGLTAPCHSLLDGHGAERQTWKMLKTTQNRKN